MFHVILFEPEIPPNTGNIIRLCANTGCDLHLIEPLGFELDAPRVRRAGLDYSELARVHRHASLHACLEALRPGRLFAIETGAAMHYDQPRYLPDDALLFGPETRGLPAGALERVPGDRRVSIPMQPGNRSLNLSNSVAVVVFEAWRQQGFAQRR
ncbi:MAG TPA: tRNA (cytidine(34)-2'-O)-methyltransferase [Steroidobacteraceae bacterium]|nr:tRNA (cytidine(34)-2'-O)-methyltransferase [Steroidobacteraceae bacterium]